AAAEQVPAEYHAAYEPTLFGSVTGVGAHNGSRLPAGGLNNLVVYNLLGAGLTVRQMRTDFGLTGNREATDQRRAQAQSAATAAHCHAVAPRTARSAFGGERRGALHQSRARVGVSESRPDRVGGIRAGRLPDGAGPIRRRRSERQHSAV